MVTKRIHFQPAQGGFHTALHARADAYFADSGLARYANGGTLAKNVFWLAACVGLYLGLVFDVLPGILGALALGFVVAQVGFNVGHEAIHRATSRHAWINTTLGWSFDVLGGSSRLWREAHNGVHHTYTNVPGVDQDVDAAPWVRFYARADAPAYARWQHVFAFGLYALSLLAWTFAKDFIQLITTRDSPRAWASVVSGKLVHWTLFLVIPMVMLPWWHVVIGYVLMQMAAGLTLAVVFQLAHVVEGTDFPRADDRGGLASPWSEHQLHTTANFATGHRFATFFTGGLNHQIEHHLFPRVSHAHYRALSAIVRRTAAEYGLPYRENATFLAALGSHIRALRASAVTAAS